MTERLYYVEPDRCEFDARVTSAHRADGHTLVTLDRTAFYPTSGGQPFDTGTLSGAAVLEVSEEEDGEISHRVDGPFQVGQPVHGSIDWSRRFDHMQQHTGQHVLSAAFARLHHARTESFHLGAATATIDLARELQTDAIQAAEQEANRIVWEDRPVSIRFVSDDEASQLPLRKESRRAGRLRLIEVDGFDLSACGGTHVARTGAIGIIAITSWARFKGGLRVEFVCGNRALRSFRTLRDTVSEGVRLLSVTPGELPGAIDRVLSESKALRRTLKLQQERLAAHEGEALASRSTPVGRFNLVVEAVDGYDAAGIKSLASAAVSKPGRLVIFLAGATPSSTAPAGRTSWLFAVARSGDVPADAGSLARMLTEAFGGRGGGKPDLAQGGGLESTRDELIARARQIAQAALSVPGDAP